MHRKPLLHLLALYQKSLLVTQEEQAMLAHAIAFVKNASDCFDRSNRYGHICGSALILNAAKDSCLLMHHKKLDRWLQLGGHADGQFDILDVALKEGFEESGIGGLVPLLPTFFDIDVHCIPERLEVPAHFHFDIRFLLIAPEGAVPVQNHESKAICWIKLSEVTTLTQERSVLRLVEKVISGIKKQM